MSAMNQKSLAEIIAERKLKLQAERSGQAEIVWNARQLAAIQLGRQIPMPSFCITGAAGTGKSTVTAEVMRPLLTATKMAESTKFIPAGSPGVAIVAFTRKAANNIRRMVALGLKRNVLTIHKLLEFKKVYHDVWDQERGQFIKKGQFEPMRHADNPLPDSLRTIVVDESSTLGMELYKKLAEAAPHVNFIFIGDINQLPPVADYSVFGHKLLELPTIELNHVYRQALESKPLALAHRVLSGKPITTKELREEWGNWPDLQIKIFKRGTESEQAMFAAIGQLKKDYLEGLYDPAEDVVLCPFNKRFGTIELNRWILDFAYPDREVHEVIAGYAEHYLAVGDLVLFNKEDYFIEKINHNASYEGRQPATVPVDRWGRLNKKHKSFTQDGIGGGILDGQLMDDAEFEFALESMGISGDDDEKVNQASHVVHLRSLEYPDLPPIPVSSAGDVNAILFSHAVTVHKALGSGWDRVYIFIHASHNIALCRELLYTAITRTKKKLSIFCEQDTFMKGITDARIPGHTAAEKAKYFIGKKAKLEQESRDKADAQEAAAKVGKDIAGSSKNTESTFIYEED